MERPDQPSAAPEMNLGQGGVISDHNGDIEDWEALDFARVEMSSFTVQYGCRFRAV